MLRANSSPLVLLALLAAGCEEAAPSAARDAASLDAAHIDDAWLLPEDAPSDAPPPGLVAEGVRGTIADGERVVIRATGTAHFGAVGPSVLLFDRFEGTPGAEIPLTSPDVGAWSMRDHSPPLFSDDVAHSGTTSMLIYDAENSAMRQLGIAFDPATEFLLSYWVALPEGSHFPGADNAEGFSSNSSWKFTWLFDGPNGHSDREGAYDMCIPTHSGRGSFTLSGNDGLWSWLDNAWFGWRQWVRITVRSRPGERPSVDAADAFFQTVSQTRGVELRDLSDRPMYQGGSEQFDHLNVPGWMDTSPSEPDVRPHYDDVYFAVGEGAAARVELGDSDDYAACRNLSMAVVETWSDTELRVRLHGNNDMRSFEGTWIHIHDADDQPVGAPIAIHR